MVLNSPILFFHSQDIAKPIQARRNGMGSRRSNRMWSACSLVFAVTAVSSITILTGCESLGNEINALGEEFIPPTPAEAATWMFDPHNAENQTKS